MEMSQNLIFLNNFSWGTLIIKNTKLGCAAQTKLSVHTIYFCDKCLTNKCEDQS